MKRLRHKPLKDECKTVISDGYRTVGIEIVGPTKVAIEKEAKKYMASYPPGGYGTTFREALQTWNKREWFISGTRSKSCD